MQGNIQAADWLAAQGAKSSSRESARGALASLSMATLLASLGTSIANVGLPTLAREFSASFQAVQWIVLAYLLASTTLIVSVGRLGDVTGRRRLLLIGILSFTVASLLCGASTALGWLIAARALQGMGAAAMLSLSVALVAEAVPAAKLGSAMGLLGTTSAVGTALGPSLGGFLIAGLGWRTIFFFQAPLGALTLLLVYRYLPRDRRAAKAEPTRFDHLGTLLLAVTLASYALAMTLGRGHFGASNAVLLLSALVGLGLFAWVETRSAAPLLRPALFRDSKLTASLSMSALVSTVMMATLVVGPFYLSRALGLEATLVGLTLSAGPLAAALAGVPAGRLVDRFGAQRMTLAGLLGIATGAVALCLIPRALGVLGYVGPIVFSTSGYALFQAANNTSVMANIVATERGLTSGMLNLSRNLGLITGASLMGAVFAFGSSATDVTQASPEAVATGMRATFAVGTLLVVFALGLGLRRNLRARVAAHD